MTDDHAGVYEIESAKLKRINTSMRICVTLLRSAAKTIGGEPGPWHVAVRRGIVRNGDEGREYDYGGADTYVASLSRQDMSEAEAKEHFAIATNTLIQMGSWEPKYLT